ncbi:Sugar transporter STL1 [Lasiodiplodia hormozganensis]|uniref:Sugar transporter STL1 n=1 Tax=Lasiodiplodia hormozganensis TaxID=869390 RepID=A0AA39Z612_9PEZI|nr:Sugar transporter STL1 [Lasiodiplodia hormozganensis]
MAEQSDSDIQSLSIQSDTMDKLDAVPKLDEPLQQPHHEVAPTRSDRPIAETRQAYGPPGFRGLFHSSYVALCAAFSAMGGLLFGYDQGVVSVILVMPQFLDQFPRVSDTASGAGFWKGLLTAMIELGALLGAFNQGWIADKISRKYSIVLAVFIFTIGSALQTGAVDYPMLVVARLIGGVGIGMLSMVAPLFISEISPPEIRGSLLEWYDIRTEVAFQKEIAQERHPKLFGSRKAIDRAKLELVSWSDCFKKGCWRRTHVGMGLMFFQQFVGINALIYYAPTLFETMGQDYDMQLVLAGVLNVAQLVGVSSSLWSMDRYGRRPLLLWGAAIMGIAHIIIAVLVGKFDDNWPAHKPQGWTSVAFLFLYMLAFGASWGPVPWSLPAEIFPSSLRAKGVALSTCSNWLNNFIIGLITPPLVQNTGFGAYTFFAVFCILAFVWTFFFVPETNGRSLEQMDHVFKDKSSEGEEARRIRIETEIMGRIPVGSDVESADAVKT